MKHLNAFNCFLKVILTVLLLSNFNALAQKTNVFIVRDAGQSVTPPFIELTEDEYDLLFSVTINENDSREVFVSNYGKKHHITEIPQQYIIQKFNPSFIPPMNSH